MADTKVKQEEFLTTEFRVSHPHVLKPSQMKDAKTGQPTGKPAYSIEMLFPKTTTDLSQITGPIKKAIIGTWGLEKTEWPQPLQLPYRDGDKPHGKKKEIKAEHQGMWVVRASSSAEYQGPHVVDRDPKLKIENEAQFYPGCWARASLKAHPYTFLDKDGVKFILLGVQKIRDDKAFGGKKPADQVFGAIAGDKGDSDLSDLDGSDETEAEESFL